MTSKPTGPRAPKSSGKTTRRATPSTASSEDTTRSARASDRSSGAVVSQALEELDTSTATMPVFVLSPVYDVRLGLPEGPELRWSASDVARLLDVHEFQRLAVQWTYIVRNRRRWVQRDNSVDDQAERARSFLLQLGLSEPDLERLAFAGHVEVIIPWTDEETGWETRIFPWEYVLTAGTRDARAGIPLSVVRRLAAPGARPTLPDVPRVLYVQSATGRLARSYDFSAEQAVVTASLKVAPENLCVLNNPTLSDLERTVREHQPDLVHLAGFDSHQGLALLKDPAAADVVDGYLLRTEGGAPEAVSAMRLAQAITCGMNKPALVTLNLHNTAGRMAPLLVAEGVGAALGFQDTFDDALAELFFGSFYHALSFADGDLVLAFDLAWLEMRAQPRSVRGSGLVLWSRQPLIAAAVSTTTQARTKINDRISEERAQILNPATIEDLTKVVQVTVEPLGEANYSLLHNNRGLFKQFAIRKLKPGRMEQLQVNVELHVGPDTYPYRRNFTLTEQLIDLNDLVRVPLTSALSRSQHEAMHTSLFVEVLWGPMGQERELYRNTHRITMLPSDQWRDDNADRIWLPSFVLPRDPAVAQIIERAQRYLMALRDDPSAGFDGYQSTNPQAEDPCECVDLQVQAIWAAILYDFRLTYINPPPAYSDASQRIRTPSEVLASGRGTCLDLTLLLAACLEFVEIYPAIFLLRGHAFPGYWRSEVAHAEFVEVASAEIATAVGADELDAHRATRSIGQREAWYLPKQSWPEMIQYVRDGTLLPVESVWLTTHRGFWDAVDAGHENLQPREEFDALLDVLLARGGGVTPLPLREEAT